MPEGKQKKGVKEMAEAIKGSVVLRSVPNKEVEAGVYRDIDVERIVALVSRTKPLTVVKDIPMRNGQRLASELTALGATAYFLQNLESVNRH
jgi:hypothetical protein